MKQLNQLLKSTRPQGWNESNKLLQEMCELDQEPSGLYIGDFTAVATTLYFMRLFLFAMNIKILPPKHRVVYLWSATVWLIAAKSRAKGYSSTYKDFVHKTDGGSKDSTGQVSVDPSNKQISHKLFNEGLKPPLASANKQMRELFQRSPDANTPTNEGSVLPDDNTHLVLCKIEDTRITSNPSNEGPPLPPSASLIPQPSSQEPSNRTMGKKAETVAFGRFLQIFGDDMNIRDTLNAVTKASASLEMKEYECGSIDSLRTVRGLNSRWFKKTVTVKVGPQPAIIRFCRGHLVKIDVKTRKDKYAKI
eukprot:15366338-Ditylum_brightwellii.AAC.1